MSRNYSTLHGSEFPNTDDKQEKIADSCEIIDSEIGYRSPVDDIIRENFSFEAQKNDLLLEIFDLLASNVSNSVISKLGDFFEHSGVEVFSLPLSSILGTIEHGLKENTDESDIPSPLCKIHMYTSASTTPEGQKNNSKHKNLQKKSSSSKLERSNAVEPTKENFWKKKIRSKPCGSEKTCSLDEFMNLSSIDYALQKIGKVRPSKCSENTPILPHSIDKKVFKNIAECPKSSVVSSLPLVENSHRFHGISKPKTYKTKLNRTKYIKGKCDHEVGHDILSEENNFSCQSIFDDFCGKLMKFASKSILKNLAAKQAFGNQVLFQNNRDDPKKYIECDRNCGSCNDDGKLLVHLVRRRMEKIVNPRKVTLCSDNVNHIHRINTNQNLFESESTHSSLHSSPSYIEGTQAISNHDHCEEYTRDNYRMKKREKFEAKGTNKGERRVKVSKKIKNKVIENGDIDKFKIQPIPDSTKKVSNLSYFSNKNRKGFTSKKIRKYMRLISSYKTENSSKYLVGKNCSESKLEESRFIDLLLSFNFQSPFIMDMNNDPDFFFDIGSMDNLNGFDRISNSHSRNIGLKFASDDNRLNKYETDTTQKNDREVKMSNSDEKIQVFLKKIENLYSSLSNSVIQENDQEIKKTKTMLLNLMINWYYAGFCTAKKRFQI